MKTVVRALALVIVGLVFSAGAVDADERPIASYAAANDAYLAGRWRDAATQYRALVEAGVRHPHLFYNLGNAEFRSGRLGPAIYAYERVLRLDPSMSDAMHNLRLAREAVAVRWTDQVQDASDTPLWIRAATWLSTMRLLSLLLVFDLLFFSGLIAMRTLRRSWVRASIRLTTTVSGAAIALVATLLVLNIWYLEMTPSGIVLDDELVLHEGKHASSSARGVLHAGLRVTVLETSGGWVRLELGNGTRGWASASAIGRL